MIRRLLVASTACLALLVPMLPAQAQAATPRNQPLTGDFDGDGRGDVGWFASGQVTLLTASGVRRTYLIGGSGDRAVVGDWDGNGKDSVGVVRGSTWCLRNAVLNGRCDLTFRYGAPSDLPIAGKWRGGKVDGIGMWRGGKWLLRNTPSGGPTQRAFTWGKATDAPVIGDWNGDGTDTQGVVRATKWHLANALRTGAPTATSFVYGKTTDRFVTGTWAGGRRTYPATVAGNVFSQRAELSAGPATRRVVLAPAPAPRPVTPPGSVPPNFFGVHDSSPIGRNGWPLTTVGTIRLWDVGVSWRDIERTKGKYDFTRLDAIVREANKRRAETLIVLGQTPRFYASKVRGTDVYGAGAASMPNNLAAYKRYVQAVANRPGVKGNRYVQFQVWNEANVVEFWNGTPAQMALLTKVTRYARGGSRYLVAPALVTRNSLQRTWMDKFYASKVSGRRVADYVNAVSLQLYPLPAGKPEDSMAILALDRRILAKYRVNKPIWNTEVNYGLAGRKTAGLSANLQAANVSRTYLLNASAGIKRVYWYSWGDIAIANTRTTTRNGYTLTTAGKAFGVTRSWLVNSKMRGCSTDRQGTYTCTIAYTGGIRRVFWNPSRTVTVAVAGATTTQLVDGTTRTYSPRTMRLRVGAVPVMIRSAR